MKTRDPSEAVAVFPRSTFKQI